MAKRGKMTLKAVSVLVGLVVLILGLLVALPLTLYYKLRGDDKEAAKTFTYTRRPNTTIPRIFSGRRCDFNFKTLAEAKEACNKNPDCGGVVSRYQSPCYPGRAWSYEIRRYADPAEEKGTFAHIKA